MPPPNAHLLQNLQQVQLELAAFRKAHTQTEDRAFATMMGEENRKKAARPKPEPAAIKKRSEIEEILAQQPSTTARMIGHHTIPVVPGMTPTAAADRSDHQKLKSGFLQSSREVGFHPSYRDERNGLVSGARQYAGSVSPQQLRDDPELRAGMQALRSRVEDLEMRRARF